MPFRLLDLPPELRVIIYGHLITQKHTTITARHPSTNYETCITLVRSEPVPPIYMTCRFLYAEAGSYLEEKIKNTSTSSKTPRIIIHPSSMYALFGRRSLLYSTLRSMRRPHFLECPEEQFSNLTENADVKMCKFSKAEHQDIVDFLGTSEEYLRNATKDQFSRLSDASETKSYGIHFIVAGKWKSVVMKTMLRHIAMTCATWQMKGFVHAIDHDLEQIDFVDSRGWVSFEGAMDIKKWNAE